MSKFLNLVISGFVTGAIYSVMASGLVLTYQASGIFNFAHAAVAFTTAYFYYQINSGLGVPIVPSVVLSVLVFAPLLGLALNYLILNKLAGAPVVPKIVGTIGLLVALPNLAKWFVESVLVNALGIGGLIDVTAQTGDTGGLRPPGIGPTPPSVWRFDLLGVRNITITSDQIAVFVVAAFAAALLYVVIRRTRVGLEMRALVDRGSLAAARGINPARTSAFAWVLTMVLAGLGGVLIAPIFQLNDNSYQFVVLGSLAAVAFAGMRSIPLAFAAGLGLGVIQNLIAGYNEVLPGFLNKLSGLKTAIPFVLTLVILLVASARRSGREAGSVSDERAAPDHREGMSTWRRLLPWAIAISALLVFVFGWLPWDWAKADSFEINSMIAPGLVLALVFLSFVVVTGIGGMVSLAQASFVTAGGFTAGWLVQQDWGVHIPILVPNGLPNFMVAAFGAATAAGVLGAIIALAVRRLGALALALGTLALAFALDFVVFQNENISHGSAGWYFRTPSWNVFGHMFWFDLVGDHGKQLVVLLLVFFGLITLLIRNLQHSASGRAMFAVRSSEVAARTAGVRPARVQVGLFALSAAIAGFAGAWYGVVNLNFTPTSAPPLVGLFWITVIVTWGVRRPGGALLAGLAAGSSTYVFSWIAGWSFVPDAVAELLTSPYFAPMLFGLGAINLARNPDGLLALIGSRKLERRRAAARAQHIEAAEAVLGADDLVTVDAPTLDLTESAADDAAALVVRDVHAGYGDIDVLKGVSLTIAPGQIVALLGTNGAGKSTFCNVVAGLVPQRDGTIRIAGQDCTAQHAFERSRAGLILVPEARGVFPGLTVAENLQILLRDASDRDEVYDRFPVLAERRKKPAGLLSGGEQQLLSLAPVLVEPPSVLIADEPTLGLSPLAARAVLTAISEIRDRGTAVLLVEEKAREALEVADTVALMDRGRIAWHMPRSEADHDTVALAYLGQTPEPERARPTTTDAVS